MLPQRRDHRKSRRRPMRRAAVLWLGQHTRPIQCIIWDMSDSGGRVAVPHPKNVPQRFTLLLTKDGSVRHNCEFVLINLRARSTRVQTH
jgi:hypothetical protein